MDIHWVEGGILLLSLILAAMSAAAETALTALTPATLHVMKERGGVGAMIAYLKHDPNRFLTTVLIVSSTSLIVASSMATLLCTVFFPSPWNELAATVGLSLIVLITAELTPKNIAVRKPEPVALLLGRPVRLFSILLGPVSAALAVVVGALMRALGQGSGISSVVPHVTEEDFRATLTLAEASEGITEEETERIEGILDLDRVVVEQVMRPRVDIVAVPVDMPLVEALDVVLRAGHSRIPVYEGSIDKIVGILYDKDLLRYLRDDKLHASLREVAREPIFVPERKRAGDLLRDFQSLKVHMAIVFDEYGGTAGLVTIEDILEEIVGEIRDEYDKEEDSIQQLTQDSFLVDPNLRVEEVNDELGVELGTSDGSETVGGFIIEQLGEQAEVGDTVSTDHVLIEVREIEGRRITKVLVTRLPHEGDRADNGELDEDWEAD